MPDSHKGNYQDLSQTSRTWRRITWDVAVSIATLLGTVAFVSYTYGGFNEKILTLEKKVESLGGGRLRVLGDFTLHGVTKEVALDVENLTPATNMPRGGPKRGASATTKINRREFGLVWGTITEGIAQVGDDVTITIDLELAKPRPAQ